MSSSPIISASALQVGEKAQDFRLTSVQGETVHLDTYAGRQNIILWFSRGFTCNFCRQFMDDIISDYEQLKANGVEVVQIAPNLLATARRYFVQPPPYPFVCDPDKRLFAVYGLGDRGVLEASKNTVISFATAFRQGDGVETVRASWMDVANRNFVRRLHHHALTAVEQGIFIIDKASLIQYRQLYGPVEKIPSGSDLLSLTQTVCD